MESVEFPDQATFEQVLEICASMHELQLVKARFLGPASCLCKQMAALKQCSKDEKVRLGPQCNAIKHRLEAAIEQKARDLRNRERLKKLGSPIDPTLPSPYPTAKPLHPLSQVRNRIVSIFKTLGYAVMEGPEIETEWFCFDALNVPQNHPARAEQDTFFLPNVSVSTSTQKKDEAYLLRTQTSTVQIRTLLQYPPPFKIISPGRVFRRDAVDAKHTFNFHQIEGLCVDETISVADLKGTLHYFVQSFFGQSCKTRFRSSFFPFTEPSFEMDIFVTAPGKLHNTWIEVFGCGMVNPHVFQQVGLQQDWQGFAFGFGVERLAMLLYGIDDIRRFYQNDERFLAQF